MATSQIRKFQKGGAGIISPWDIVVTKDEENLKATVIPGLLNNFLAQNWSEEFTLDNNSLYYAKAVVKTDGTIITNLNIKIDKTAPKVQTPKPFSIETEIEILFGLIRSGAVYRTVPIGQIFASPRIWITAKKDSPVNAGELPYDEYFYLI
jgi:hypothetical protein